VQRILGKQRFKTLLSDSVVNADNASLSGMDTTSFLSVYDEGAEEKGSAKAGGGSKAMAKELEKVFFKSIALFFHICARLLPMACRACLFLQLCYEFQGPVRFRVLLYAN
jgi:hypothetical protein